MTLEDCVMASTMVVVLVSGMDLVMSSDMPSTMTVIIDLVEISGIAFGAKLLAK